MSVAPARVVVVEDEDAVREAIVRALTIDGYLVAAFADARETTRSCGAPRTSPSSTCCCPAATAARIANGAHGKFALGARDLDSALRAARRVADRSPSDAKATPECGACW